MAIDQIFSSSARIRLLQILIGSHDPLRTRYLERRSGLAIRSVQIALEAMQKEKLVLCKIVSGVPFYSINKKHALYDLLLNIFHLIKLEELKVRAKLYEKKAKAAFAFSSDMIALINTSAAK